MKPYKTVIYSFLVGGTFALIAQAILTFWQTVLVGTPMAFFMGGATLISMGVIGCILGGLACYQYVEEWATFGALLPFSGFAMAVGMKAVGPWTKNNEKMGKCIWNCVWFVVWFNVLFAAICIAIGWICGTVGLNNNLGVAKTEGGMQLGKAHFSGSCAAEGDIHAEELEIAGSLRAPAVEAERFHASGVFRIDGLLNAGEIILSRGGLYQAGDIGCTTLRVVQDAHVISLGRRKRALEAQSIEGDTLELLDTQAAVVRGRFVCVGAGCVIDRVEYSEDLTVEDGGIVKEPVRC